MHTNERQTVHEILEKRPLQASSSVNRAPSNGIYFNYEKGEIYSDADDQYQRIVHVGINRESENLRERLKSHYAFVGRRSIFRNHVGTALLTSDGRLKQLEGRLSIQFTHRQTREVTLLARAAFPHFEDQITEYMVSSMTFRFLKIEENDLRKKLEKRLIRTLALCPDCRPSQNWLGRYALNAKVSSGHLWNDHHTTNGETLRPEDLDYLQKCSEASVDG